MQHMALGEFDCSYCGDRHPRASTSCPSTGRQLDPAHEMGGTVLADIVTSTPPNPTSIRSTIPEPVARVIMRCLEKEPSRRFQSAGWMLRALRAAGRKIRASRGDAASYSIIRPPEDGAAR
jgi:hypothetical protein